MNAITDTLNSRILLLFSNTMSMKKKIVISGVLSALFYLTCFLNGQTVLYISTTGNDRASGDSLHPLSNISEAITRLQVQKCDATICFYPGIYVPTAAIMLTPSASHSLTFRAMIPGKTVISGGKKISNFRKEMNGIYKAATGGMHFEQLYINGRHALRARYPNADRSVPVIYLKSLEFEGNPVVEYPKAITIGLMEKLPFPAGNLNCEMIMIKDWATLHKQVMRLDTTLDRIHLKPPFTRQQKVNPTDHNHINASTRIPGFSCFLEGNPVFIDQPGEWACDRDFLYYLPKTDEDMNKVEVIVPVLETLVKIQGDSANVVHNIRFEGIIFAHASHILPAEGHDGTQCAVYYNYEKLPDGIETIMPAAVEAVYAKNCSFSLCEFRNMGCSGIRFGRGCKDNVIERSDFFDIAGNGILIGTMKKPWSESFIASRNVVKNCRVHECAWQYPSGVGIWIGFGSSNEILHNEVYNLPYTGISCGWQWNPFPTPSQGNKIKYNHVHDVMKVLGDGGGIYVLGNQPGTEIEGNLIHAIHHSNFNHGAPNNGLYFDEGSKNYYASRNVIYDISHTSVRSHRGSGVTLENNYFIYGSIGNGISHSPPYRQNMIMMNTNDTLRWTCPDYLRDEYDEHMISLYQKGNHFVDESKWDGNVQVLLDELKIMPGIEK